MKKVKLFAKKVKKLTLDISDINFKNILLRSCGYIRDKSWLLSEKEFWFLSLIFFLSLFSIPTVDHIFFTIVRFLFVLMLTTYMLYQLYLYSNQGIKMNGFLIELDKDWFIADRVLASILFIYFAIMLSVINLSFYVIPLFFVFLKRLSEKKYK